MSDSALAVFDRRMDPVPERIQSSPATVLASSKTSTLHWTSSGPFCRSVTAHRRTFSVPAPSTVRFVQGWTFSCGLRELLFFVSVSVAPSATVTFAPETEA